MSVSVDIAARCAMTDLSDIHAMRRAIHLAMAGRGSVEPNPLVGCVVVKNGAIIGEGYHQQFGAPHAEANALAACSHDPAGATAFVSLEPCSHLNKKTPPCAPRLIAARIGRVVVACRDPNPMVAGRGIEQLRLAGLIVDEGLLAAEARQLNAAFFKQMEHRRPYVTLKWAQTADGKVADAGPNRLQISSAPSLAVMHNLRARCDAILAGIGTILADDPALTARGTQTPRPLLRVVLDSNLRVPISSQLVRTAVQTPTVVFCSEAAHRQRAAASAELKARNVEVTPLPAHPGGGLSLKHLLDELGRRTISHLLVEPGPALAAGFLRQNLADRAWIFRSPIRLEQPAAPAAPALDWPTTGNLILDGDLLTEYLNPASPVFYCPSSSADLVISQ